MLTESIILKFQSTADSSTSTTFDTQDRPFQSTRSSQTSTTYQTHYGHTMFGFQSTRSSQTSTPPARFTVPRLTHRFQSTRSSQTSTVHSSERGYRQADFNPRGLRRPRPDKATAQGQYHISIHEVFADLDFLLQSYSKLQFAFQSTRVFEPRRHAPTPPTYAEFQSTRSSQTSTGSVIPV